MVDGPDDQPFRLVAETYTQVLNPFGMAYGRLDFVGKAASGAGIVGGFADTNVAGGLAGIGAFWIRLPDLAPHNPVPYPNTSWAAAMHEGAHAYLGTPDFHFSTCTPSMERFLFEIPPLAATFMWVVSRMGEDFIRYWSLMSPT
jgi:hypothetical protein